MKVIITQSGINTWYSNKIGWTFEVKDSFKYHYNLLDSEHNRSQFIGKSFYLHSLKKDQMVILKKDTIKSTEFEKMVEIERSCEEIRDANECLDAFRYLIRQGISEREIINAMSETFFPKEKKRIYYSIGEVVQKFKITDVAYREKDNIFLFSDKNNYNRLTRVSKDGRIFDHHYIVTREESRKEWIFIDEVDDKYAKELALKFMNLRTGI